MNPYKALLALVSAAFDYDILAEALFHLRNTSERVSRVAASVAKTVEGDLSDSVWEDTSELIETLHGAAFLLCQASLTGVISRVIALHKFADNAGTPLTAVPKQRRDLLIFGSSPLSSTTITAVQSIDAVANYFKHHDEWPRGWSSSDPRQKQTIDILNALGFSYGTSLVLTKSTALIGGDLDQLGDSVVSWQQNIANAFQKELSSLQLL